MLASEPTKVGGQEKILGKRKSFRKTDPDATFVRMKEDHRKNGQQNRDITFR